MGAVRQLALFSPLGRLTLTEADEHIVSLDWGEGAQLESSALLEEAKAQLESYFNGERRSFDLPLDPPGTNFQRKVWKALQDIPYGETATYGEIAKQVGTTARPVGQANGRNPLPILIPCHRVVGADGSMTGYTGHGGVQTKIYLLRLENPTLI